MNDILDEMAMWEELGTLIENYEANSITYIQKNEADRGSTQIYLDIFKELIGPEPDKWTALDKPYIEQQYVLFAKRLQNGEFAPLTSLLSNYVIALEESPRLAVPSSDELQHFRSLISKVVRWTPADREYREDFLHLLYFQWQLWNRSVSIGRAKITLQFIDLFSQVPLDSPEAAQELHRKIGPILAQYRSNRVPELEDIHDELIALAPQNSGNKPTKRKQYPLHTIQEFEAYNQGASDGASGKHWINNEQEKTRIYVRPELPYHQLKISLTPEEEAEGCGVDVLNRLTQAQDADCPLALLYVASLALPPGPYVPDVAQPVWIDLLDIARKIGYDYRSQAEVPVVCAQIWNYLRFGERAYLVGERSIPYLDYNVTPPLRLSTRIEAPLLRVLEREVPVQRSLWTSYEVPIRVKVILSEAWVRLMSHPKLAQYVPCGELLGSIPPNRPSGSWARVLGLALANHWRRYPGAAIAQKVEVTRYALLSRYTAKRSHYTEVLESKNPMRAVAYWHTALACLKETGFLANEGEAQLTLETMKKGLPRKDWQEGWLSEKVMLAPGPKLQEEIAKRAAALPSRKPKNLKQLPHKRSHRMKEE